MAADNQKVLSPTVDQNIAESFGKLFIYYNGGICPTQTFALDFTQRIYG